MKIECTCGHVIADGGDALPHKAHVVPDGALHTLFDAIDDVVTNRCQSASEREAACTALRSLIVKVTRQAWQCSQCGRLYIDDAQRVAQSFLPEGSVTAKLFAS